jgi:hypothetical protein
MFWVRVHSFSTVLIPNAQVKASRNVLRQVLSFVFQ